MLRPRAHCDVQRELAPRALKLLVLNFHVASSSTAHFRAHLCCSHDTVVAATELDKLEQGPLGEQLEVIGLGEV